VTLRVLVCDVGPRDGLQNEPDVLPAATRAELISRLASARLARVEAVSFVRGDRVPQMADAEDVVALARHGDAELSGLVLNERGYERFAATSLDRVNCTLAATETFNERNGNATLEEAVARVLRIVALADRPVTVTVSRVGLPFRGRRRSGVRRRSLRAAARRGRACPRGYDRRCDAPTRAVAGGAGLDPRAAGWCTPAQHEQNGLRMRLGGAGGGGSGARRVGRRDWRLPVLAERDGEHRYGGPRLAAGAGRCVDGHRPRDALVEVSRWLEGVLGRQLPGTSTARELARVEASVRSTSASVVCQLETEMRIAARPSQVVPPIHVSPDAWTPASTRCVSSSVG
jgi:hypothetical protein